jgi:uncharacterized membrane protein YqjE
MDTPTSSSPGFFKSLTGLGDNLLGALQDRIELVSIELKEEKHRLMRLLIWMSAAVFAAVMALSFATLTVVYLLWDTARLAALGGFAVFYTAILVWIGFTLRRMLSDEPKPFDATIESLTEDRECIRSQN